MKLSSVYSTVRKDWDERKFAREVVRRRKWYEPLHGDPVLQGLVDEIIRECDISLFVETGTFVGDTSKFVALRHPDLMVLTCEANPRWLKLAQRFCQGIDNIQFYRGQSPRFLEDSYDLLKSGNALFWLDAHWGTYWPLVDETKIVSSLPKFAAIIDDFEVPDRPEFHYDTYAGVRNGLALHAPVMGPECLVPDYDPAPPCENPAGYGLFFKGIDPSGIASLADLRRLAAQE
jgi:hypothetical protein